MQLIRIIQLLLLLAANTVFAEDMSEYIQKQINKSQEAEAAVAEKLPELISGTKMPPWRLGNPGAIPLLLSEGVEMIDQTGSCNKADTPYTHGHSFAQLHLPPIPIPGLCSLYFLYPGVQSGVCMKCIENEFCPGGCFWLMASAVDYVYPTHKINISEQLLLTRYLPQSAVIEALTFLLQYQKTVGQLIEVPANYIETLRISGQQLAGEITPQQVPFGNWAPIQSLDAPTGKKGFYRHFPEIIIPFIDSLPMFFFIPHEILQPPAFISDVHDFQTLYWLRNSNGLDGNAYQLFSMAPQVCVMANMGSGKTPAYPTLINPAWQPLNIPTSPTSLQGMYCLKDVGEVFPYTAMRRLHSSDGIFQTFVKGMKRYLDVAGDQAYTFRPDMDLLHLVRSKGEPPLLNERLAQDKSNGLRCDLLDTLSDLNTSYSKSNEIEPGLGAETTIEIFTRFRGCWGFKGSATMSFDFIVPTAPTRFADPAQDRRVR